MPAKEPRVKTNTPGVYRRGKKWLRKLDAPSDDGKRKQRWVTADTRRELDAKVNQIISSIHTGTYVPQSKVTVADMLDRWIESVETQVRPVTLRGYRSNVRKLKKAIGSIKVTELRPEHLTKAYAGAMASGTVSAYVAVNMHRVISQALSHAVRLNLVQRNVAMVVKPPRPKKRETATLTPDDVARLLDKAQGSEIQPLIVLTLATGLRRSEVCGLQWRDIDLDAAELRVERGLHVLKGGEVVYEAPKSSTSRRVVALPPSACIALRAHRESMEALAVDLGAELQPETPVFMRFDGSPMRPDTVSHQFGKFAKDAELEGIHFHSLRHSHATLMLAQDVHPLIVSRRLGHSQISVTLDLYSHPGMDLQQKAAEAFDVALKPKRAGERMPQGQTVAPS